MPDPDDAIEPAIDLLEHALDAATRIGDETRSKFARNYLAKCYRESNQLSRAIELLTLTFDACRMPEDALLCFDASQQIGDCCIEQENDAAALIWYQRGLDIAREIDDPFEVSVQLGKIASALSNLKRYDEALSHYEQGRDLLIQIGGDDALQRKITVHGHLFNPAALPGLIAYNDKRAAATRKALGRDLLRELPAHLAASTQRPWLSSRG